MTAVRPSRSAAKLLALGVTLIGYKGRLLHHKKVYFIDIEDETGIISAVTWRSNLAINEVVRVIGMIVKRENQPADKTPNGQYELIVAYTLG